MRWKDGMDDGEDWRYFGFLYILFDFNVLSIRINISLSDLRHPGVLLTHSSQKSFLDPFYLGLLLDAPLPVVYE